MIGPESGGVSGAGVGSSGGGASASGGGGPSPAANRVRSSNSMAAPPVRNPIAPGASGSGSVAVSTGSDAPAGEAKPSFIENLERVLTMDQEQTQIKDLQDHEEDLPMEEFPSAEPVREIQPETQKGLTMMEEYERIMNRRDMDPDLMMAEGGVLPDALEVIDLDDLPGTDYFEIVRDFDAGTAVVYSAIINRLDY